MQHCVEIEGVRNVLTPAGAQAIKAEFGFDVETAPETPTEKKVPCPALPLPTRATRADFWS
jgi:hypothetical protein